ncbi:Alkaline phosphatase precursor [Rosistilla carotiformis]|uniref:Alkaline phosphatase n=1 Tax=Rosistilla carotiformis TaxID=2528017 RepID=A0A518JSV8_9BACT|nr:alkaline phosphatase [Rosistilla carotiformis]QDV68626.1 Alkaline phosphatase precursor [Rosistilla carotiformis]
MNRRTASVTLTLFSFLSLGLCGAADPVRQMQADAMAKGSATWGYWGTDPSEYSTWTSHSNRLIPIYTFGLDMQSLRSEGSVYSNAEALTQLYGQVPNGSLQPEAEYFDQTDIYRLQKMAVEAGKKKIILMVFDGMDWETTQAAAIYKQQRLTHETGRGTGLKFLDYRTAVADYGYCVTSAHHSDATFDVSAQLVINGEEGSAGGYDPLRGGKAPWDKAKSRDYLIGKDRQQPDCVTDSASSATSMVCGVKTYNAAINVSVDGKQLEPIGRWLQREHGFRVGIVTSVPISHATPAAAYANNVSRNDYQDLTRDLLGLPSCSHRMPLSGADVVIGAGWGVYKDQDSGQGQNFAPGNTYADLEDLRRSDLDQGGRYVVAQRTPGENGASLLSAAARRAIAENGRLLGFFGTDQAHLPFRTADGRYDPAADVKGTEVYEPADINENPTLAQMTEAALQVLESSEQGFWLMIEAGDVDWANHANNIDSSIGAVLSGEEAFQKTVDWIDGHDAWEETALIVTSDHGHHFVLREPEALIQKKQ